MSIFEWIFFLASIYLLMGFIVFGAFISILEFFSSYSNEKDVSPSKMMQDIAKNYNEKKEIIFFFTIMAFVITWPKLLQMMITTFNSQRK